MRFTFRLAFRKSYSYSYYCDENTISQRALIGYGDSWTSSCSDVSNPLCYSTYLADTGFHCTDFSDNEDWSMGENNFTYTFPSSNSVWTVRFVFLLCGDFSDNKKILLEQFKMKYQSPCLVAWFKFCFNP